MCRTKWFKNLLVVIYHDFNAKNINKNLFRLASTSRFLHLGYSDLNNFLKECDLIKVCKFILQEDAYM